MKKKRLIILILSIVIIGGIALFIFRCLLVMQLAPKFLLQAGQPMTFGDYTVVIDRIEGNKLFGIKVSEKNRKLEAKSGEYEYNPKENIIKFNLIDGVADNIDPKNPAIFQRLTFKQSYIKIKLKSRPF